MNNVLHLKCLFQQDLEVPSPAKHPRGGGGNKKSSSGHDGDGNKRWNRGPVPSAEDLDKEMEEYNKKREAAAASGMGFGKMAVD